MTYTPITYFNCFLYLYAAVRSLATRFNEVLKFLLQFFFNLRQKLEVMQKEIWRSITGYEAHYQVSNLGRIKRLATIVNHINGHKAKKAERILKDRYGVYSQAGLCVNGIVKYKYVHRLVACAFIVNEHNKPYINHKDGNKRNNHFDNLEWVTPRENNLHAFRTGLRKGYAKKGIREKTKKSILIIKKLIKSGATISAACVISGIHKTTYYNYLRSRGIEPDGTEPRKKIKEL